MSDVFISYAREDAAWAEQLRDALSANGLDVWWDTDLMVGGEFSEELQSRLDTAKAVVVIWSEASVGSSFVRDEAAHARDADKLVPVSIDETLPPLGFGQHQTTSLAGWAGDAKSSVVRSVAERIGVLADVTLNDNVKGGARTWLDVTPEQARKHRLNGFGGSLLALYIAMVVIVLTSALGVVVLRDQALQTPEAPTAAGWASIEEIIRVVEIGALTQFALCVPFLLLPLIRWRWMPHLAAAGILIGQLLWPFYWLPPIQPIMSFAFSQVNPSIFAMGVAAYLLLSERVRLNYRRQVRNTLLD